MVDYSNIPRDSRRVPLETRVQFKFDRFSGFISEYSANISPGGMFIRTRAPQPPGTVLDLEFRLGDGFELIKGRAEVVWVRAEDEGSMRPAGMGLRFQELAPGSKELIYRIVDEHIAQGGTPFDVTKRPPDLIPSLGSPAAPLPPPLAAGRDWPPAAPPPPAKGDVFDLPDLAPLAPVATQREPDLGASASSWLPPAGEPEPYRPAGEPFPDLFEPPAPEPPVSAPSPMFASTFGGAAAAPRKPRRILPLAVLAAVLLLAVGLFLFQDTLMEMTGLGGGEEVVQTGPPATRPAPRPRPPASPAAETAPATSEPETTPAAPPAVVEDVTAPAPAVPEPAPAPAAGPALGALENITTEEVPGGTDVILWGDGAIRADVYSRTRIDGNPPRELFRLSGIRRPFSRSRVVAGSAELLQIRVGYHPGNQLHVVLDLAHPTVQVAGVEEGPKQLRIHLKRR
ncbi:MAG TPA: TIGR02266 family protein [Thermoanaerobaculia bacterium]